MCDTGIGRAAWTHLLNIPALRCLQAKPLFWVESVIEKYAHSRVEYMIKVKSQFKKQSTANNVEVEFPVPPDADSPKFKTTAGSAKWLPQKSVALWTIKSFQVGHDFLSLSEFPALLRTENFPRR